MATDTRPAGDSTELPQVSSAESTPVALVLADLCVDAGTQVRVLIDDGIVAEYAEHLTDGAVFPPVTVYRDGSGLYLADGFHRYRAHQQVGRTEIQAVVHEGSREDALWFALGANRAHGHRLTAADKRHAVELAFKAWPDRSSNRLAKHIGCSQQYVSKIRAQVTPSCNLPDRTVGADGKSYPASRQPATPRTAFLAPVTAGSAARTDVAAVDESASVPLGGPGSDRPPETPAQPGDRVLPSEPAASGPRPEPLAAAGDHPAPRSGAAGVAEPVSGPPGPDAPDPLPAAAAPPGGRPVPSEPDVGAGARPSAPARKPGPRASDRSNRIVSVVVSDAQNLTTHQDFIDFAALDRDLLPEWIAGLESARRDLGGFIRRLRQELGDENSPRAAGLDDRQGPA